MKTLSIKYLTLILLLFTSMVVHAQYDNEQDYGKRRTGTGTGKGFDGSRWSVGGGLGAAFGDVVFVDVSPVVAYKLIEPMQIGVGAIYQYTNYTRIADGKSHLFGGRIFDRFFVWENLFAQVEYLGVSGELGYIDINSGIFYRTPRKTYHTLFAGGGYNLPLGENVFASLQLLVNLNTNNLFPRHQPIFNVGIIVGL